MLRSVAGAAALLFMAAGCGHGATSATSTSALASQLAQASCLNPAPLGSAISGQNQASSAAPGDASPVPVTNSSYPSDAVRSFVGPGLNGTVVLSSPQPATATNARVGVVLEVLLASTNGDIPFHASDFSVQGADGRWYAGMPARLLDPSLQNSLSEGVLPAHRMIEGFIGFDPPGKVTTLKFIGVGLQCNPTETWPLG
jgi:hypothetical protein